MSFLPTAKKSMLALACIAGFHSAAHSVVVQQTSYYADCFYAPVCGPIRMPAVFQVTLTLSDALVNAAGSGVYEVSAANVQSISYSWVVGGIDRTSTLPTFDHVTLSPTFGAGLPFGYQSTDSLSTGFYGGTQVMSFHPQVATTYSTEGGPLHLITQPAASSFTFTILTAPVPEPATWSLAAAGLVMLMCIVRRRSRTQR